MDSSKIIFSVDVEPDLHDGGNRGIHEGLKKLERLCDKHDIKPTLFIVASTIKKNKEIFKKFKEKGWDLSLHGFSHKRFDDMPIKEKESEIKKSLAIFKKELRMKPKGFRAPQHSIDEDTLNLLEKYGFEYDSSYTPFNLLQFFFFPKRVRQLFRQFFSKTRPYKIRENLLELPVPALIIPPVSLIVRVLPKPLLWVYFMKLKIIFHKPVFYAHSWDFIKMEESKIDRTWSHEKFIDKLDYVMSI